MLTGENSAGLDAVAPDGLSAGSLNDGNNRNDYEDLSHRGFQRFTG